jgi:hypothetical protein
MSKNPLENLFNELKKKGLFPQYKDYEDYCKQRGVEKEFKNEKETRKEEEINIDEIFKK